jgi:surface protein
MFPRFERHLFAARFHDRLEVGWISRIPARLFSRSDDDIVTMVLMERETGLPLDLVVLINSFLYERLTDENFHDAIALWFENEEQCKWRFGHISDWNTSRITNMTKAFHKRYKFNEDLSGWNVRNVVEMRCMFFRASQFNGDLSRWNVGNVSDMTRMFSHATRFNGNLSRWNVGNVMWMRDMRCKE